jgi:hypothetical protein
MPHATRHLMRVQNTLDKISEMKSSDSHPRNHTHTHLNLIAHDVRKSLDSIWSCRRLLARTESQLAILGITPHDNLRRLFCTHVYGLRLGHDLAHIKFFVCMYNAFVQYIYMNAVWIHLKTNGIFVADML